MQQTGLFGVLGEDGTERQPDRTRITETFLHPCAFILDTASHQWATSVHTQTQVRRRKGGLGPTGSGEGPVAGGIL